MSQVLTRLAIDDDLSFRFVGQVDDGNGIAARDRGMTLLLGQPARGIFQNRQRFGLLEDIECFVPRSEVEDASLSNLPDSSAAKMLARIPVFFEASSTC